MIGKIYIIGEIKAFQQFIESAGVWIVYIVEM